LEEQCRQIVGSPRLSIPDGHRKDLWLARASLLREAERLVDDGSGDACVALVMCADSVQDHQIAAGGDVVADLVKQGSPVARSIDDGLQAELVAPKWQENASADLEAPSDFERQEVCAARCGTDERLCPLGNQKVTQTCPYRIHMD
jgi:hypothetical protein